MNSVKRLLIAVGLVGLGMGIGWSVNPVRAEPEKPAFVYEMRPGSVVYVRIS